MTERKCHVHGCSDPVEGAQIELRMPLDQGDSLSQLTVRTWVCTIHRRRFAEAGLLANELSAAGS